MQIVDSITLEDCLKVPFTYSKDQITFIEFSNDSQFLTTAVGLLYLIKEFLSYIVVLILVFFNYRKMVEQYQSISLTLKKIK